MNWPVKGLKLWRSIADAIESKSKEEQFLSFKNELVDENGMVGSLRSN
jgi:hypothetical protein